MSKITSDSGRQRVIVHILGSKEGIFVRRIFGRGRGKGFRIYLFFPDFYRSSALLSVMIRCCYVCLSSVIIAGWFQQKQTYNDMVFTKRSPKTLVFGDVKMLRKFEGYHRHRNNLLQVPTFWNSESYARVTTEPGSSNLVTRCPNRGERNYFWGMVWLARWHYW